MDVVKIDEAEVVEGDSEKVDTAAAVRLEELMRELRAGKIAQVLFFAQSSENPSQLECFCTLAPAEADQLKFLDAAINTVQKMTDEVLRNDLSPTRGPLNG